MYKSLKLNQRNLFDLIPCMTVIFSDYDFTMTAAASFLTKNGSGVVLGGLWATGAAIRKQK